MRANRQRDRQTDRITHLLQAGAEALEHLLHVATLLHGDDTQMILLIHPHQEGLVVVVPEGGAQEQVSR